MTEQSAPRNPCLPAAAQKELEELRTALHTALGWWAEWERQEFRGQLPPLAEQDGGLADDYRRCCALLDPPKEAAG